MQQRETVTSIRKYYDQQTDEVPPGTGLVWYLGQDQLHPPRINDEHVWTSQKGWIEGAKQTVRNLIKLLEIKKTHTILDVGSGVGGIGRIISQETGARVIELNISETQLRTGKILSNPAIRQEYEDLRYLQANGLEIPIANNSIDRIISVNMFYHFPDLKRAAQEFRRVLKPNCMVGIDDWFLTPKASRETKERLRKEWSSPEGFHIYQDTVEEFEKNGFEIIHEIDMTDAGIHFLNQQYFGQAFDSQVTPVIIANFPKIYRYDGYKPEHAIQAAKELKDAVMLMGDLYRNGELVYKQLVVRKN